MISFVFMRKLIAANWKMNNGNESSASLAKELAEVLEHESKADIVVCPPFTSLGFVSSSIKGSNIRLGAQNMHYEESGAFTGEISPLMLKSAGCEFVILGHSERREFFREEDILINKKIISALKHGLVPILCIGETLEQKKKKWTEEVLEKQLNNCLSDVENNSAKKIIIAYEPVWAISRGDPNAKAATPKDAETAHHFIRSVLAGMYGNDISDSIRILYGGSMKPENAKELLSIKGVDGGLIGNASLNAKSFAEIVKAAEKA